MQKKLENTISVIIAIFPALSVYELVSGVPLAFFLLWMNFIPLLFIHFKNTPVNRDEIIFLFCIILISEIGFFCHTVLCIEWFDSVLYYHNLYSIFLCLVPLCFVTKYINTDIFVKTLLFFGFVASIVLIWQWLLMFFWGSFPNNIFIPGLKVTRDLETLSWLRPSAFFTEPAHFAIYMLPAFQIALVQKRALLMYLFALSILCCGSSTGFILISVLLIYHLYKIGKKKWYVPFLGVLILALSVLVVYFVIPDVLLNNFDKLYSVKDGKSDVRLLGPLKFLSLLHPYEYVFGITLNQLRNLMLMDGSFGLSFNYANAAIYMLISFGIVGFVVFFAYIVMKIRSIKESYGFFLIFIGIVCSDQILFNGHYFYLVVLVLMTDKIYGNNQGIAFECGEK